VVTRGDLTDGYKAVQSTHAAINFTFEHPSRAGPWFKDSNYLVLLEVPSETQLKKLAEDCRKHNLACTVFREPDIGNEVTAIAIEPSPKTKKMVAHLPLLFKSKINNNDKDNSNQGQNSQSYQKNIIQETPSQHIRQGETADL